MVKKGKTAQEPVAVPEHSAVDTTTSADNLRTSLEEIETHDGIVGYILRNSTSAAINIKDPTKIIDYAVLSSSTFEVSKEFSELFDLGDIKNVVIEGKDMKVLSLTVDENKVSVFMEKNVDCEKILRRLHEF